MSRTDKVAADHPKMNIQYTLIGLIMSSAMCSALHAQRASEKNPPVVLGRGVGLFTIGKVLFEDDFADLGNWVVQVQPREQMPLPHVKAKDGTLDCFVPGRGCTVWFKQKLKSQVTISYSVLCPISVPAIEGLEPRDINNFWMATDPQGDDDTLFDSRSYTGSFNTYDKIHGYYASTGGGKNTTTRMRRYPRQVEGKPVVHLALKHRDGQAEYLITPGITMRVQLVAYDDVVQYIVDGRLVYEIASGDQVQVERCDAQGRRVMEDAKVDLARFPVHQEGYFGFRMVGTHHIYSNFRVHVLDPLTAGSHDDE
ncbi:MAG: hypothetical protein ACI9R3_001836 [Verrucomicrobiales bacterium]|jgi:hypothetical protein